MIDRSAERYRARVFDEDVDFYAWEKYAIEQIMRLFVDVISRLPKK